MSKVISFLNGKSSGKTTCIRAVAGALCDMGHSVHIIDRDEEKPNARTWRIRRENNPERKFDIMIDLANDAAEASKLAQQSTADFVLIDTAGDKSAAKQRKLTSVTDFFVINCLMDLDTCDSAVDMHQLLDEAGLPHRCVYVWEAGAMAKNSKEHADYLRNNGVPLFKNHIRKLKIYRDQIPTGLTTLELENTKEGIFTKSAHTEIKDFVKELIKEVK